MPDFPGKGQVAVLQTRPETVLEDIQRLMSLAGVEESLPKGVQTGLKIKKLFSMIRGHYELKDQERDQMLSGHVLVPLSPEKVVIEGVREYYPPARIKKEFPGIEKKTFSPAADLNDRLTTLRQLERLMSLGTDLRIKNNPLLPTCEAEALRDRLRGLGWQGEAVIEGNDSTATCD